MKLRFTMMECRLELHYLYFNYCPCRLVEGRPKTIRPRGTDALFRFMDRSAALVSASVNGATRLELGCDLLSYIQTTEVGVHRVASNPDDGAEVFSEAYHLTGMIYDLDVINSDHSDGRCAASVVWPGHGGKLCWNHLRGLLCACFAASGLCLDCLPQFVLGNNSSTERGS